MQDPAIFPVQPQKPKLKPKRTAVPLEVELHCVSCGTYLGEYTVRGKATISMHCRKHGLTTVEVTR